MAIYMIYSYPTIVVTKVNSSKYFDIQMQPSRLSHFHFMINLLGNVPDNIVKCTETKNGTFGWVLCVVNLIKFQLRGGYTTNTGL
jgi:hypothetical protein